MKRIEAEFLSIREDHWESAKRRSARVTLGSSVIRVFRKGTKTPLMKVLADLDMDALKGLTGQVAYEQWFTAALTRVARIIRRHNRANKKIMPGYRWGHAAKVLCIYCRDLLLNSRYFTDRQVQRIEPWLYVPIDRIVMDHCRRCGVDPGVRKIKEIDTRAKFFHVQNLLTSPARKVRAPRVWFDDAWGDRPE